MAQGFVTNSNLSESNSFLADKNILDNLERFIGGIRFIGSNERTPEFEKNMIEIFDIKDFYPKITDVLSFEIIAERFEKNFYEIINRSFGNFKLTDCGSSSNFGKYLSRISSNFSLEGRECNLPKA